MAQPQSKGEAKERPERIGPELVQEREKRVQWWRDFLRGFGLGGLLGAALSR
jgi:hypothetical protein